ncbi:MAG: YihA family ribosome biogenesis GTP-binding protein [Deltaproteobacteria bacterium]|nr:YihA family ribosome biogenesis GTP-binding protein [Deltaproteobacteria bacterium]MBW2445749.1 YihA family ribosome biogenesis GTP-binding protein [Deltaproteobacteria bacterium]
MTTERVLDAKIVATAAGPDGFPTDGIPEIAFLGRSNVGKSSLLNKLANRKKLARTSSTPGKTRLVHFFELSNAQGSLLFVDLPGYGYAKVSKKERASWRKLVESYLGGRKPLKCAVLLQDARRDPREEEIDLIAWLGEQDIPVLVAVTKCDKLGTSKRSAAVREIAKALGMPREAVVPTSASKGFGIPELWGALDAALHG